MFMQDDSFQSNSLNQMLLTAAQNGDVEALKNLLKNYKVNTYSKDENGNTPLLLAAMAGHVEALKVLFEYSHVYIDEDMSYLNKVFNYIARKFASFFSYSY
jgi:ankyrin repeat protein